MLSLKLWLNGQQKRAACFATLLQNQLNSHVARFTSHKSTCLEPNQVDAVCEKFLQKGDSSTFATKSVHVTRLTGPRQTCFAARDLSHVFCDSRIHTTCNKRILNVAFQLVRQQCCYMQVKGFCFPFQRCLRFQYTRLDRHSAVTGLFFP